MDSSKLVQIIIELLVLLAALGSGYWLMIKKNPVSAEAVLDRKDKWIMLALTLVYAAISLVHLGAREQYASWQGDAPDKSFSINFTQPTALNNLYYYYGMGSGALNVEYVTSSGTRASLPLTNNSALYKWVNLALPNNQEVVQLNFSVATPGIELKKLALYDNLGRYVNNYTLLSNNDADKAALANLISPYPPQYVQNNSMSSMYFDEIYYARTAWEYLNGKSPYAWVHPPLGMLIIGLGIILFGMNPLGWRIMPALSGILLVPVVYLFAKKLFKNRSAAIIAALLMMTDFMHFSICRMASIDSLSTLWITLELYYLYSYMSARLQKQNALAWRHIFWCGVFFGLGMSTKWDGLFTAPLILAVLLYVELWILRPNFVQFRAVLWRMALCTLLIPLTIYGASYAPYYYHDPVQNFLPFIYNLQGYMIGYHTGFTEQVTHPYASNWWGWPLLTKPISIFFWQDSASNLSSSIVLMGNPAIWWGGCLALIAALAWLAKKREKQAIFLLLAIASLYLPWSIFGRLSFDYYFYVVTPLWVLLIVYGLDKLLQLKNPQLKYGVFAYVALVIALFVMFYPAISGTAVSRDYVVHYLLWFSPAWNF